MRENTKRGVVTARAAGTEDANAPMAGTEDARGPATATNVAPG